MTELERALVALGEQLDVPPAALAPDVRNRIRRRRRTRRFVVLAVPVAALAVAFAVPQARSAILRFFHVGAVNVERVETLPPAAHVAPTTGLAPQQTHADAERVAGFRAVLGGIEPPRAWWARTGLIATRLPNGVLLVELSGDQLGVTKKFVAGEVQPAEVGRSFALWIQGGHVLAYSAPDGRAVTLTRYSGNALVWARDGVTYRLEGEPTLAAASHDAARITP
jgi:hypothetical protein